MDDSRTGVPAWAAVLSALWFLAACSYVRFKTAAPTMMFNGDTPIFLEGAWRVLQGQVPHRDFSTPLGLLTFLVGAAGMKLVGVKVSGLDVGAMLVFLVTTPLPFWAGWYVRRSLGAVLLTLLVGSYLITPRMFNYEGGASSYTGYYNLIGYAWLYIIMMVSFTARPVSSDTSEVSLGAVTAALALSLCLVKVTFGVSALALLGYSLVSFRTQRTFRAGVFVGSLACGLAWLAYLGWDPRPILRDLSMAADVRRAAGGMRFGVFLDAFLACWRDVATMTCGLLLVLIATRGDGMSGAAKKSGVLLLATGIGVFITISICQPPEFAIAPGFLLLCWFWVTAKPLAISRTLQLIGIVATTHLAGYTLNGAIQKNLFGLISRYNDPGFGLATPAGVFHSETLAEVGGGDPWTGLYNDGIDTLRTFIKPTDKIIGLVSRNPFSFALKQPSSKHDLLYWMSGWTFDDVALRKHSDFAPERMSEMQPLLCSPRIRRARHNSGV